MYFTPRFGLSRLGPGVTRVSMLKELPRLFTGEWQYFSSHHVAHDGPFVHADLGGTDMLTVDEPLAFTAGAVQDNETRRHGAFPANVWAIPEGRFGIATPDHNNSVPGSRGAINREKEQSVPENVGTRCRVGAGPCQEIPDR
jgi:hypothetical protein